MRREGRLLVLFPCPLIITLPLPWQSASIARAPAVASPLHTTARVALKGPPKPTGSEESVRHDDHDMSPEELQEMQKKESEHQRELEKPTHSEDAVHGERHHEDPLPEHKKKRSNKP